MGLVGVAEGAAVGVGLWCPIPRGPRPSPPSARPSRPRSAHRCSRGAEAVEEAVEEGGLLGREGVEVEGEGARLALGVVVVGLRV